MSVGQEMVFAFHPAGILLFVTVGYMSGERSGGRSGLQAEFITADCAALA